jgi:hypothetical protein
MFILGGVALLGIYGYWQVTQLQRKHIKKNEKFKMTFKGKAAIGGPWNLTDVNDNQ